MSETFAFDINLPIAIDPNTVTIIVHANFPTVSVSPIMRLTSSHLACTIILTILASAALVLWRRHAHCVGSTAVAPLH